MKKTVNINLAGYGFTIDDDAYSMLKEYLETLESVFRANDYDDDLIDDIELRAAELLQEMAPQGAIVTTKNVEEVIRRLGRPEEMVEVSETVDVAGNAESETISVEAETATPPPFSPRPKHRLYRDLDDKMLGGVCSGIAAYFNFDVVWVRLAFVLVTFASFSVASLAYIILWIVVPAATTPLQKMELRGTAPTMDNIGRQVTSDGNTSRFNADNAFTTIWKVFLIGLAIVCLPVLLGLGIAFFACLVMLIVLLTSGGLWFFEGAGFIDEFGGHPTLAIVCCLCIILFMAIPMLVFLMTVFSSYRRPLNVGKGWRIAGAVIWILSIIGMGVTAGTFYHDTERESRLSSKELPAKISTKLPNIGINIDFDDDDESADETNNPSVTIAVSDSLPK